MKAMQGYSYKSNYAYLSTLIWIPFLKLGYHSDLCFSSLFFFFQTFHLLRLCLDPEFCEEKENGSSKFYISIYFFLTKYLIQTQPNIKLGESDIKQRYYSELQGTR